MMFWYGNSWSWWAVTLMWLGMVAFWALVIWAIYALVRGVARASGEGKGDKARAILDERLARGEINDDEYRAKRELIKAGPTGRSPGEGPQ